ncbi:hypothetical protein NEUTE2DRAFT_123161 [Neurospora tetrasperma FGSC 2509]|nr:hypothetical protein NEUTE2DRAFT_123161 [Neurospora tetrasperma FGSC 2509]
MPNNVVRLSPLFPTVTARRADHPQNAIKAEVADRGPLSCGDTMPMVTRNRALSDQGFMLAHDSLSLIGSQQ